MARSRNIKPGLFKNELLGDSDPLYTIMFTGLWCLADKKGRLEDRPKRIKAEIFPYRFDLDASMVLAWLSDNSFINRYQIDGVNYIQISKWNSHQSPHHKEAESIIPDAKKDNNNNINQPFSHAMRMLDSSMIQACPKKSASTPLIPDSLNLIPDSLKKDKGKNKTFKPPIISDVTDYISEKGFSVVAEQWFDFYGSKNWMIGKNKMSNWKLSINTWQRSQKDEANKRIHETAKDKRIRENGEYIMREADKAANELSKSADGKI